MNRLDEIRQRLEASTPGPWRQIEDDFTGDPAIESLHDYIPGAQMLIAERINQGDPDATLIAHAPADLRDLLTVAEAAYRVQQSYERGDVRTTGLGTVAIEQLDAALARLNVCMCGAQLEDGECRSDHHFDFAVTDASA